MNKVIAASYTIVPVFTGALDHQGNQPPERVYMLPGFPDIVAFDPPRVWEQRDGAGMLIGTVTQRIMGLDEYNREQANHLE